MLAQLGASVIDADAISKQLTAPGGAAIAAIAQQFGAEFITAEGALDRPRMRVLIFENAQFQTKLQAIIHPLVRQEAERLAASAQSEWLVFDIPLLVESQDAAYWRERLDRILVVDCEVGTQIERVAQRPGWSRETAEQAVAAQATRAQRLACADGCLYNDAVSLAELAANVQKIAAMIRAHKISRG